MVEINLLVAGRKLLQSGAQAGAGAQAGSNGGFGGGSTSSAQATAQAQSGLDGGAANAAAQAIASSGVSHALQTQTPEHRFAIIMMMPRRLLPHAPFKCQMHQECTQGRSECCVL